MTLLKDIARHLGLSVGTVSQILHRDDPRYSAKTKERVRDAARQFGYQANALAQTLATGRTRTIAVYVPMLFTPTYARVLHHMGDQLYEAGYQMVTRSPSAGTVAGPANQWPVDMTIFVNCGPNHPRLRVPLPAQTVGGRNFVSMGTSPDETGDWIAVDLFSGATEALQHLYDGGRRRIGYLVTAGAQRAEWERRAAAYLRFTSRLGLEPVYVLLDSVVPSMPTVRQAVFEFVREGGRLDALFCHSDELAIAAYRGLLDAGVRVPDDVALVGCDGLEVLDYLACPLTTIVQPVEEMCRKAREFMEHRIRNPDAPRQSVTLKAELRIRESSRPRT